MRWGWMMSKGKWESVDPGQKAYQAVFGEALEVHSKPFLPEEVKGIFEEILEQNRLILELIRGMGVPSFILRGPEVADDE